MPVLCMSQSAVEIRGIINEYCSLCDMTMYFFQVVQSLFYTLALVLTRFTVLAVLCIHGSSAAWPLFQA